MNSFALFLPDGPSVPLRLLLRLASSPLSSPPPAKPPSSSLDPAAAAWLTLAARPRAPALTLDVRRFDLLPLVEMEEERLTSAASDDEASPAEGELVTRPLRSGEPYGWVEVEAKGGPLLE